MQRTCSKCSWVFPSSYHQTACKFCKTRFPIQFCNTCKEWVPTGEFHTRGTYLQRDCKACASKIVSKWHIAHAEETAIYKKQWYLNRRAEFDAFYEEWKSLTSSVTFKVLTEEQWLQTCSYFNGCAFCDETHIETREFLVGFQHGGRYAPWNMLPVCGNCSIRTRTAENPFIWMDKFIGSRRDISDEKRERLLEYFISQIEKVKNDQQTTSI